MPLLTPKSGEKESDFISRCMGNESMKDEYPDNDQRLAVCYSQWDKKSASSYKPEKRTFDFHLESRSDNSPEIVGHAAVFNTYADIMWWQERILPGAFKHSIKKDDVRALFNHDPNYILGRNKSGTLSLKEDEKGLYVKIMPPDTQFANDLVKLIERGDISQMSFAFQIIEDAWEYGEDKEPDKRDINKVKLYDVSPVTYPAYTETDVSVRSYQEWQKTIDKRMSPQRHTLNPRYELERLKLKQRRKYENIT